MCTRVVLLVLYSEGEVGDAMIMAGSKNAEGFPYRRGLPLAFRGWTRLHPTNSLQCHWDPPKSTRFISRRKRASLACEEGGDPYLTIRMVLPHSIQLQIV